MLLTSSVETDNINPNSMAILKECHSVSYGGECGWVYAYGRDKNGKLVITVHGKDREEFLRELNPEAYRKSIMESALTKAKEKAKRKGKTLNKQDIERIELEAENRSYFYSSY